MSEEKIYIIKSSQLEYGYPGVKDKDPNFYKHIIPCNFKEDNSKKSFIPTSMDSYALFPDSLNTNTKKDNVTINILFE